MIDELGDALAERAGSGHARCRPPARRCSACCSHRCAGWLPRLPAADSRARRRLRDAARGRAGGCRALVAQLAARRPLVIAIDDFQWSDADSVTFLAALTRPPDAPPFLLVLRAAPRARCRWPTSPRRLAGAAPLADARELAAHLLSAAPRAGANGSSAESIATEAGGHPLFMSELAWRATDRASGPPSLDDVLWDAISACPGARGATSSTWSRWRRPRSRSGWSPRRPASTRATSQARCAPCATSGWLRTTGVRPDDVVEMYRDRIRETVVAHLAAPARALLHLRPGRGPPAAAPRRRRRAGDPLRGRRRRPARGGLRAPGGRQGGERPGVRAGGVVLPARAGALPAPAPARERCCSSWPTRWPTGAWAPTPLGSTSAPQSRRSRPGAGAAATGGRAPPALRAASTRASAAGRNPGAHAGAGSVDAGARLRLAAVATARGCGCAVSAFASGRRGAIATADVLRVDTLWAAAARLADDRSHPRHRLPGAQPALRPRISANRSAPRARSSARPPSSPWAAAAGAPVPAILERARPLVERLARPYARRCSASPTGFAQYQSGAIRAGWRAAQAASCSRPPAAPSATTSPSPAASPSTVSSNLGELAEAVAGASSAYSATPSGAATSTWRRSCAPGCPTCVAVPRPARAGERVERSRHRALVAARLLPAALLSRAGEVADRALSRRRCSGVRVAEADVAAHPTSLLFEVQAVRTEARYLRARAALADGSRGALAIAERTRRPC